MLKWLVFSLRTRYLHNGDAVMRWNLETNVSGGGVDYLVPQVGAFAKLSVFI